MNVPGIAFDVALHVGTLTAVMVYFRREVIDLLTAWGRSIGRRQLDGEGRLAWLLPGTAVSAVSAFLCIDYFLRLIERVGMMPFVVYRLLLGACCSGCTPDAALRYDRTG